MRLLDMCPRRAVAIIILASVAVSLQACSTPISEVKQRANELDGQSVRVAGEVRQVLDIPLVEKDFYLIADETDELWVMTDTRLPAKNDTVRIQGIVRNGLRVGDRSFLVVLEQTSP